MCFANVHMVMEAHKDHEFKTVVNSADIAAPDGKPLSLFMKLFYGVKQSRICGMDYMPILMEEAESRGKSVFFYGSTEEVLNAVVKKSRQVFPSLRIAGTHSPPFRTLTVEEDNDVIEMINASKADFVFSSLGCPKQEKWMFDHMGKINSCMLGVGQAFLTFGGIEKRLPKWTHDLALEWLYRLYQEPGRLWKRYLITNGSFLFLTFKKAIKELLPRLFTSPMRSKNLTHR